MDREKLKGNFVSEIKEELNKPGSGKPTLEEFKQMVYEDRERRKIKNRIKRLLGKEERNRQ